MTSLAVLVGALVPFAESRQVTPEFSAGASWWVRLLVRLGPWLTDTT